MCLFSFAVNIFSVKTVFPNGNILCLLLHMHCSLCLCFESGIYLNMFNVLDTNHRFGAEFSISLALPTMAGFGVHIG
jgi:hypothetical protein